MAFILFRAFRFILEMDGNNIPVSSIVSSSAGDTLTINAAHQIDTDRKTCVFTDSKSANLWLISDDQQYFRKIEFRWSSHQYEPINLDATSSEIAINKLHLFGVTYKPFQDVGIADSPAFIRAIFM